MIIDVPEGKHPVMYVWGEVVPRIGPAAAAFAQSVYDALDVPLTPGAGKLPTAQRNPS